MLNSAFISSLVLFTTLFGLVLSSTPISLDQTVTGSVSVLSYQDYVLNWTATSTDTLSLEMEDCDGNPTYTIYFGYKSRTTPRNDFNNYDYRVIVKGLDKVGADVCPDTTGNIYMSISSTTISNCWKFTPKLKKTSKCSTSTTLRPAIIAGIVIGVVIGVTCIGLVVWVVLKKKKGNDSTAA